MMNNVIKIKNMINDMVYAGLESCGYAGLSEVDNLKMQRTFTLKLPRQSGLTFAAIQWASYQSMRGKDVLYITLHRNTVDLYYGSFLADYEKNNVDIKPLSDISRDLTNYRFIILDPGSYVIDQFWEKVEKYHIPFSKDVIILVLG